MRARCDKHGGGIKIERVVVKDLEEKQVIVGQGGLPPFFACDASSVPFITEKR
ncbi:MAG: hypothetical protein WA977_07760 [Halobacteriota archaeon]